MDSLDSLFCFLMAVEKGQTLCMTHRFLSENAYIDNLARFCGKVSNKKLRGSFIVMEQFSSSRIGQEMAGMVFEAL